MEELQCSLLGFSSTSLPLTTSDSIGGIAGGQGSSVFSQLHPSERALIEEVLPLGAMCFALRKVSTDIAVGRTEGLYPSAIGAAVTLILQHYEEAVQNAMTPSAVAELRPTYFPAFTLLLDMVKQQNDTDILLSTIRTFVSNREIPREFRVILGEAVWMGLLYTIGHYVAHGVVLHGRKDFFITMKSKSGKEEHTLHSDLLPHGLSLDLGLLILSVGKERRVLLSDVENHGNDYLEQLAMGTQDEAANAVFKAIYNPSLCSDGILLVDELETRIEAARALWSKSLWLKVGEQAALHEHLAAMRAMFLCHRGDLWHTFVETAFPGLVDNAVVSRPMLTEAVITRIVADAFVHALGVSGLAESPIYERFSTFVVLPLDMNSNGSSTVIIGNMRSIEDTARTILGCMRGMGLHYVLPRGLHLVISEKALEYYQRIFSFHIARRFSLHALHLFRHLFSGAFVTNTQPSPELRRTFALMHLLLFLHTTLGYHLQVDVVVLQTSEVEKALEKCKSVQDAKRCLDRYVWHVAEGSFITEGSGPLLSACESLFQCSLALYVLCIRYRLTSWAVNGSQIPAEVSAALTALETRVHQDVVSVFTGHLSGSATRPTERALWARLDFNRFLSAGMRFRIPTQFAQPAVAKARFLGSSAGQTSSATPEANVSRRRVDILPRPAIRATSVAAKSAHK
ncbi:p22 protein precursor [Trypanosoma theileri]|uniref:Spindle pole body component n=1 Tax=Trypanosoma theileri TaxID=67003 RepID=A0A1X0P204_9TRYP|nr:p22 protein precursor [Trypanosoma theileri]ORC90976.1 p22 protein precursor [Trypanosoma theileri]